MKYLRNKKDGWIFEWSDILAKNAAVEEVTEEQAYPERFIPKEVKADIVVKPPENPHGTPVVERNNKKGLSLNTADIDILKAEVSGKNDEVNRDASRRMPK